jgi:hypothetical protein
MNRILYKVITERFFKINAGFFLLFFLVLFGLLDGRSTMNLHYTVMQGITSSLVFQLCAMAVWVLYNVKCLSFTLKEIDKPENGFLFNLQTQPNARQYWLLLQSHVSIYCPILLYGGVTVVVGFMGKQFVLTGLFILFQLAMCAAGAAVCFNRINSTWKKPAITIPAIKLFRKKKFSLYLLHYSLHSRKGTFIGIKLFSLLLLQAMVAANSSKVSKEAMCVLIMFLISAHSLLPLYYVRFMEDELAYFRNLPVSVMQWLSVYVISYAIIFLPELAFLLLTTHHALTLEIMMSLYAVAVSQMTLYTAIQYIPRMTTERYTGFVFALFFITLLMLASFSLWGVFVVEVVLGVGLFVWLWPRHSGLLKG